MNIFFEKKAIKSIKKLDKIFRQRILTSIHLLPQGDVKKLQGYINLFRLRVGDYRIIFSIDNESLRIYDVLPRGEAYRRL